MRKQRQFYKPPKTYPEVICGNFAIMVLLVAFVFSFSTRLSAQDNTDTSKVKKVSYTAQTMSFDRGKNPEGMLLKGDVVFNHEGVVMYCDSAYFYDKRNSLEAYGQVHLLQGDSIELFGHFLEYNGNTRFARVIDSVRLYQNTAHLETDTLNYDRNTNVAWYPWYGKMIDSTNSLESIKGYYYTDTKDFLAIDSVVLRNPDYDIFSDTLRYNTETEIAKFYGPTEIISDSNYIYCEQGIYNTKNNTANVARNAMLKNKKQTLTGDSLYYERYHEGGKGFGEAFQNVTMVDSVEKMIMTSHYAYYYEEPERALLVDSTHCIHIVDGDSLHMHADTIRMLVVQDSLGDNKMIKAYRRAKIFKSDFQGMCDSVLYSFRDSTIKLFFDPVLWSQENQITAEYIEIHTKGGSIDRAYMNKLALIISEEDSIRYNQIKGKEMTGYFSNEELRKIDVVGNGESIYYVKEDDGMVGVNKAQGKDMKITFEDKEVKNISMILSPEGTMHPPKQLIGQEAKLKGFQWLVKHRPMCVQDIFVWTKDLPVVETEGE